MAEFVRDEDGNLVVNCVCFCHEQSEMRGCGMGVQTHTDRCVCNGGTGFTAL